MPPAPPDWDKLYRLAQELFQEERFAETAEIVQNILDHHPEHTGALVLSGFVQANGGRFAEALAACERAIGLDDLLPEAYFLRGLVFEMTDRLPEAGEEYRKAILLEHNLVMAHYQLAQVHGRLGKTRERTRELKNTLKIVQGLKPLVTVPHSGGMPRERFLSQVEKELAQAG
jgi:chemotaxis protein methyltransferase CheR